MLKLKKSGQLKKWLQINADINFELTIKTVLFFKLIENKLLNHLRQSTSQKTKFLTNFITLETFLSYVRRKTKISK